MAQHYEVKAGETLAIQGPANVIVKTGVIPAVGEMMTPAISDLEPDAAICGDAADIQMVVTGTGFNELSKIVFNGFEEPTTLLSPTEVRTIVKPSLFTVAAEVPVSVRNGDKNSNELSFNFTEAGARGRRR